MDFDYGLRYCYEVILLNFCPYCGARTSPESQFCTTCGSRLGFSPNPAPDDKNIFEKVTDKLGRMSGVDGKVELKMKDLFSDIFKKHTTEESEAIFISGTAATTPPEETIASTWPKPWLYTRVFLMFMATFLLLYICVMEFSNINALPGLIMIGSLVIPFSLILFFMELNVPRNISFFMIMKVFFLGGCASLLLSLLLYEIFPGGTFDYLQAIVTGVVEEVAKLAIVAFIIFRMPKMKYMLNGMLVGAAVGAGFAAFESAGYAFRFALESGVTKMMDVIILRAFLSPGGHVAWAAIAGAALMLVKKDQPLKMEHFTNKTFYSYFIIPVVLHSVWDMPIPFFSSIFLPQIILSVIVWIVILVLVNVGLNQIANHPFGPNPTTPAGYYAYTDPASQPKSM